MAPGINNRAILGTLGVAFVVYTAFVYTSGTAAEHLAPMNDNERAGAQVFQDYLPSVLWFGRIHGPGSDQCHFQAW